MAQITDIAEQVKDKTRRSVYVDGKYYCSMNATTLAEQRLEAGMFVDEAELDRIQQTAERADALEKALRYISVCMKTEKEVYTYLQKRGYVAAVCAYVVERLKDYRYIDDSEYSESYLRNKRAGKGSRLLAMELRQKGIDECVVENALESLGDETDAAQSVLARYMRGKSLERTELAKGFRYLLRKGFDYDTAQSAVNRLRSQADDFDDSGESDEE